MRWLALLLIRIYQRFISPYKGYGCAHRIATGEVGCSGYGKRVIDRYGFLKGVALLRRRFYDCHWHYEHMRAQPPQVRPHLSSQAGFIDCDGCDVPSGGCEMPDCGSTGSVCNLGDLADGSCLSDFVGDVASDSCSEYCDDRCGSSRGHDEGFRERRNRRNQAKARKRAAAGEPEQEGEQEEGDETGESTPGKGRD
jgi:putative component of membrane protein insertase Oxa1/YidC/SpoIIIJ protein YidD